MLFKTWLLKSDKGSRTPLVVFAALGTWRGGGGGAWHARTKKIKTTVLLYSLEHSLCSTAPHRKAKYNKTKQNKARQRKPNKALHIATVTYHLSTLHNNSPQLFLGSKLVETLVFRQMREEGEQRSASSTIHAYLYIRSQAKPSQARGRTYEVLVALQSLVG